MALYRFISRNITVASRVATEEELLQETLDEMKDALEEDLAIRREMQREDVEEDFEFKFVRFKAKADERAEHFKRTSHGYRRICCVPAFALGLVMASRFQGHYAHAPWFRLKNLAGMIDVYGTVSMSVRSPLARSQRRRVVSDVIGSSSSQSSSSKASSISDGSRTRRSRL